MTAQELFTYLTADAGLDDATTKVIMDQVAKNEKVNGKATSLKQASEYTALETRAAALQKAATDAAVYQDWYAKNYAAIEKLQKDALRYQERYGALDEGGAPAKPAAGAAAQLDETAVATLVNKVIQENYGPRWSDLVTNSGTILEKHIRAGRKAPIDWKKVGELAQAKGGDLSAAYDEWDAPEREAATKLSTEAEIDRRVKEEVAKRQTAQFFPAGAEGATSLGTAGITKASSEGKKYDRNAVVQAAITGKYDGAVQ